MDLTHRLRRSSTMRIAHRLVPGILAGSLLLGGASGVLAAQAKAKAHWAAFAGQISSVTGNTFTLTLNPKAAAKGTAAKTLQVTLSSTTRERALAGTTGAPAAGDYAVVVGIQAPTGLTANRVIFSAKAFAAGRMVRALRDQHTLKVLAIRTARGTVQSSTATTLVITTKAGKTLTFQVTTTTHFRVNGQPAQVAPIFTTGEQVVVRYTRNKATKQFVAGTIALRGA